MGLGLSSAMVLCLLPIMMNHNCCDNFAYDNMLDCYCDAVDKLKDVGEVAGCHVTVLYLVDYAIVKLAFCDSSRQPIKLNDSDYVIDIATRSFDTKFLQFMKGRSEAYFTPTIQEIVQRMKK